VYWSLEVHCHGMGVPIDDYLITMKFEDHQVVIAQNSYNLKFMMYILHTSYNLQEMELQVNFNKLDI
jgi:hypothetical protein